MPFGELRILIFGAPGSGKTALAKELSEQMAISRYGMDDLYWGAGWTRRSTTEMEARLRAVLEKPAWTIDGNYAHLFLRERLDRCTHIIWLRPPLHINVYRFLRRSLRRASGFSDQDPEDAGGSREPFRWSFFIQKVLRFDQTIAPSLEAEITQFKLPLFTLQTPNDSKKQAEILSAWLRD